MPRKIGYGDFTPARQAALKKAQLESARKRRRHNSEQRSNRKKKLIVLGAAAAAGVGIAGVVVKKKIDDDIKKQDQEYKDFMAKVHADVEKNRQADAAAKQARDEFFKLKKAAGNIYGPPMTEEEYKARITLYGADDIIGETSPVHGGRAEIFPGVPKSELIKVYTQESLTPSTRLEDGPEDFVILYHRTGGDPSEDGNESAVESILKSQSMKILNRDEKRVHASATQEEVDSAFKHVWLSNKLNDSNTRDAFGESVVQIKFPKSLLRDPLVGQQSFGKFAPGEVWAAIPPDVIDQAVSMGYKIERVPPEQIKPKIERSFRVPK